jgi:triosephosphate isomerase
MDHKKIIIGNWKMNKNFEEAIALTKNIIDNNIQNEIFNKPKIILAVPYTYIRDISKLIFTKPNISLAAQNCHHEDDGPFTGEISASMLYSTGAEFVILGHSERRTAHNESDILIKKKIYQALNNNLKVIFCCGESSEIRKTGEYIEYIKEQLKAALLSLDKNEITNITIAYEPIWAIGTGSRAANEDITEVLSFIKKYLEENYGDDVANRIKLLYGGSCDEKNSKEILNLPNVDGLLVGKACLDHKSFLSIVKSAHE